MALLEQLRRFRAPVDSSFKLVGYLEQQVLRLRELGRLNFKLMVPPEQVLEIREPVRLNEKPLAHLEQVLRLREQGRLNFKLEVHQKREL